MQPDQRSANGTATAGNNPYLVNSADFAKRYSKDALKVFDKAGESMRKGKLDEAISRYHKAISLAPDLYPAHNDLGTAYMQKQDFSDARSEFEQVVKLNPSDASAYLNLANVELLTGNYQQGLGFLNQGLSKQPGSGFAYFIEGSLFRHLGKLMEAEQALHQALQMDPSLAMAHLELVNLYRQEENRPLVIAELESFLKLYPANPMAPKVREALQKLTVASSR